MTGNRKKIIKYDFLCPLNVIVKWERENLVHSLLLRPIEVIPFWMNYKTPSKTYHKSKDS